DAPRRRRRGGAAGWVAAISSVTCFASERSSGTISNLGAQPADMAIAVATNSSVERKRSVDPLLAAAWSTGRPLGRVRAAAACEIFRFAGWFKTIEYRREWPYSGRSPFNVLVRRSPALLPKPPIAGWKARKRS